MQMAALKTKAQLLGQHAPVRPAVCTAIAAIARAPLHFCSPACALRQDNVETEHNKYATAAEQHSVKCAQFAWLRGGLTEMAEKTTGMTRIYTFEYLRALIKLTMLSASGRAAGALDAADLMALRIALHEKIAEQYKAVVGHSLPHSLRDDKQDRLRAVVSHCHSLTVSLPFVGRLTAFR